MYIASLSHALFMYVCILILRLIVFLSLFLSLSPFLHFYVFYFDFYGEFFVCTYVDAFLVSSVSRQASEGLKQKNDAKMKCRKVRERGRKIRGNFFFNCVPGSVLLLISVCYQRVKKGWDEI
jgi:hypothetical protein